MARVATSGVIEGSGGLGGRAGAGFICLYVSVWMVRLARLGAPVTVVPGALYGE
jgi:hypothetical protein